MVSEKQEILRTLKKINVGIITLNKLLRRYDKEEDAYRCDKCSSAFVYVRRKDRKLLCRKCGNIQDIKMGDD